MATSSSSSIFNFLSLLIPSKPPPPPTTAAPNFISTQPQTSRRTGKDVSVPPLVLNNENQTFSSDISSVVCPSLAYSNTLFFRSAYNVQVIVDDNEPEEKLLNRFRREVMKAGVIQETRRRRYFENKQDEKKRRTRDAAKRNRKRRPFTRTPTPDKLEASKKDSDDEDNWELPMGVSQIIRHISGTTVVRSFKSRLL